MLTSFRTLRPSLAALAVILSALSAPALADTYQVTVVSTSQHESFFGIDTHGDFVVNLTGDLINPCGGGGASCFETFDVGQSTPIISTSAPALSYDDGSVCSPTPFAGFMSIPGDHGVCNNGHFLIGGRDAALTPGVWDGPDPIADRILIGSFDGGFMNSSGDAVFIDGFNDTLVSAVDLTTLTPEPGSLLLLGTGCIGMLGAFRRFRRG